MRNTTPFILLATLLLQSCFTSHKAKETHKETLAVKSATKTDSTNTKHTDSAATLKEVATHLKRTVSVFDTTVLIGADSAQVVGLVPTPGKTETFVDGNNTIQVGLDRLGRLSIKTTTKARPVLVRNTTTSESFDTEAKDLQTKVSSGVTVHAVNFTTVDSTRSTKDAYKDKVVKSFLPWWVWLILIGGVVCYSGYKIYSKGANPLRWFT